MNYRALGRTGLRCSEIGLGTWAFSSGVYGPVAEEDASAAVNAAVEAGINFFDTAPLYGNSQRDGIAEEVLGRALRDHPRDSVLIATKFGPQPDRR
jgi:aryl-alcohol dehydrogenase-like predicted oxidoreductase